MAMALNSTSSTNIDMNRLADELFAEAESLGSMLRCASLDRDEIKRAPLRLRIILNGLLGRSSPDEVNAELRACGLPELYARSFLEATLIFSFSNGLDFAGWLSALESCADILGRLDTSGYFSSGTVTFGELESYVLENSDAEAEVQKTRTLTKRMDAELKKLGPDKAGLLGFLEQNLACFSVTREKARYYFCKYLYYYLQSIIGQFFSARRSGVEESFYREQLCSLIKVKAYLDRHRTDPAERISEELRRSALSLGGIFDSFCFFFFGYVTEEWQNLLDEVFEEGSASIPAPVKRKYLRSLGLKDAAALKGPELDEAFDEAQEQRSLELDESVAGERCGEAALRRYLRGDVDLDRTTLVCMLLFCSSAAVLPPEQLLTERRVDEILSNCGYPALRDGDAFDSFVRRAVNSRDPEELWATVSGAVSASVRAGENSFLYRSYRQAVSNRKQIERFLGR